VIVYGGMQKVRRDQARERVTATLTRLTATGGWVSAGEVAAGTGSTWDTTFSVGAHLRRLYAAGRVRRRVREWNTFEYRPLDQARAPKEQP
jgi:hypothetical protein